MKRLISLLLACVMAICCAGASAETIKHERVYVVTGADGGIRSLTDNVRLENRDALDELTDRTALKDVQNVGGHETFTLDGETLTWQANGKDITYRGSGEKQPEALPRVTLTLDGQAVTAAELREKTGEAKLEVGYDADVQTPALAVTVILLPEDGVSDIVTENAAVLSEAGRRLLVGWAVPGADASLKLPASFSAAFRADHADLKWTMTLITSSPIEAACREIDGRVGDNARQELDEAEKLLSALENGETLPGTEGRLAALAAKINELNAGLSALDGSAKQLSDGMAQAADGAASVKDGAAQLSGGAAKLNEGAEALAAGMTEADGGAAQLKAGLDTLTVNNETLNQGAEAILNAILDTANAQLAASGLDAAGIALPALTAENYADVLQQALDQLDPEALRAAALEQVQSAVRAQVEANADQVRDAVRQAVRGKVLDSVLTAANLPMNAEQFTAAVNAQKVPADQAAKITAAVDAQMETEEVKAQLEQAVKEQIEALVKENTGKYMASDDTVAAKLAQAEAARESIGSLKAQLDQISAFVAGVAQYTAGVAQAADGAAALNAGMDQLSAGAASLAEGAAQLNDGAASLAEGSAALADGAAQLKDGAALLQSEGTAKLQETLLNAEKSAAGKLLAYAQNDLADVLRVYEQTRESAQNAGYDLCGEGMKDVTVYVIRTDLD